MDLCPICKVEECYCGWANRRWELMGTGWDMDEEEESWRRIWDEKTAKWKEEQEKHEAEDEAESEGEMNYEDFDFAGKVFLISDKLELFEKLPSGEPGAKVGMLTAEDFKAQSAPPLVNPAPPPTAPAAPAQPQ